MYNRSGDYRELKLLVKLGEYFRQNDYRELSDYRELENECKKAVNSVAFPGGPPAQYYPGLASLSYGVRMGSSVFNAVWSTANLLSASDSQ